MVGTAWGIALGPRLHCRQGPSPDTHSQAAPGLWRVPRSGRGKLPIRASVQGLSLGPLAVLSSVVGGRP